jgi:hypothetical protein
MNTDFTLSTLRKQPLVRPVVWLAAAAILAVGFSTALALETYGPTRNTALAEYQRDAVAVLARHNALAARWNEFVPRFNAVPNSDSQGLEAIFDEGRRLTQRLVRDSQAVVFAWRRLSPPEEAVESHRLGLAALEATQDGYIAMEDYFTYYVKEGIADESTAQAGRERLKQAAQLWQEARAASAAR